MKRGKPLVRRSRLRSGSALPKRNPRRAKARRERDFGDYAEWIRGRPCVIGEVAWRRATVGLGAPIACTGHSEPAHVKSRGAGGRALGNLLSLCHDHHSEQHSLGIKSFAAKYSIDLSGVASALAARYREETGETS